MIRVEVVTSDRSGFILAIDTGDARTAHVVGQAYRINIDGEPEGWKAWLWPAPGLYPPTSQSIEAVTRKGSLGILREVLRQRHDRNGAWWS